MVVRDADKGFHVVQKVWMPPMDHSSFIWLKNAGLSTLGVMLISAMPHEPVWVYLGLRCTVTLVRPSCVCLQNVKPLLSTACPQHPLPPYKTPQALRRPSPQSPTWSLPCPTLTSTLYNTTGVPDSPASCGDIIVEHLLAGMLVQK